MLDVRRSPELQATILALKQAQREVRLNVNKNTRKAASGEWLEALNGNVSTRLEQRVIVRGARVKVGTRNITLLAATSKRPLKGGLIPASQWAALEFGARPRRKTIATKSRKGNPYNVTKTINTQFRPRTRRGYVANAAASTVITRIVGIWVRTLVDELERNSEMKATR